MLTVVPQAETVGDGASVGHFQSKPEMTDVRAASVLGPKPYDRGFLLHVAGREFF